MTEAVRPTARDLLGENGPFARSWAGYEAREGQLQVADAVERLLARDGVLLCEAGTGIGKTFAYLIPALLSGRKVVISTATKTLQDQIAGRDLPRVLEVLGLDVPFAVMKGLSNYLCRRRYKEFVTSEEALRPGYAREIELVRSWIRETESGQLSELASLDERARIRLEVASSSETRIGSSCPDFESCFVTEMRRQAEAAQIVIVNHHLFFADLALRGPHPGRVLPDYDAVLFDEAHQLEDTAAAFFGARLTRAQLERLAHEAARVLARAAPLGGPLDSTAGAPLVHALLGAIDDFFRGLVEEARGLERGGRVTLGPESWSTAAKTNRQALEVALADLGIALSSRADFVEDSAVREVLEQSARRAENASEDLRTIAQGVEGRVTWMEASQGNVALSSTPVDLSGILRSRLFENVPAVGLLSATLSTRARPESNGFSYVRARLGVPEQPSTRELSVQSPFVYSERCVLYLPDDLPAVTDEGFLPAATSRVAELIRESDGGAFVLTTSIASMRKLHEGLQRELRDHPVWVQGSRPKETLISAFRASQRAVLVATASFWEGIDVPGHALRLVVLEKLPFSPPNDPVFQARGQELERRGRSAFADLALPSAAIQLKQGFGRLIRRTDDRGMVALLDDRALRKPYGKILLGALPDARRTSSRDEALAAARALRMPGEGPLQAGSRAATVVSK
ncbi:MAG TPA: ATP-dependent DNA helicase [Polyangiaceae bacterium]|nr:ATP-dependent DNA helicase [Polyangiaceae bacterium]